MSNSGVVHSRLESLMREHRAAAFPSSIEKGLDYGDIEPVLIDADIYGWALRVSQGTSLGTVERPRLEVARDDLARSLDSLPDEARPYYERLVSLANEALEVDRAGRGSG